MLNEELKIKDLNNDPNFVKIETALNEIMKTHREDIVVSELKIGLQAVLNSLDQMTPEERKDFVSRLDKGEQFANKRTIMIPTDGKAVEFHYAALVVKV